ncbi:PKD domain-containing protein, partial [Zoogloea sp.]|uniref:PKD domain-containing protein n=1 Tax=Zoogloea sp. TaxID=49181 RepID=UPI002C68ED52
STGRSGTAQSEPAIAHLGSDNLVVVYTAGSSQDGNGNGIYQQLLGSTAEMPRTGDPQLTDVRPTLTLGAAQAILPQLIDNDVAFANTGSNYNGASLLVYFTSGAVSSETLSIRNEGAGATQVGLSGTDVTFGGTLVGSFSGGSGGAPLSVTFNASATAEAVEAVVENIQYQFAAASAPAGTTSRTVAFRFTDGNANSAPPVQTTITIQAANPSVSLTLDDVNASQSITETQAQAGVLLDTDVQFVQGAGGLNGGTLTVSYSANGRPQDQLSVLDEGAGAGQVGVSGANISFEGTVVGTYTGGTNGTNLVVTFNGAATENAVERVIEHLRYQSSGDGALPSRTVQISFRDAASATASDTVVINIAQEVDGAGPLFGDERVNSYLPGNQTRPAVSAFADGSYVVVWQSEGQDGNGLGVFGQRFTATGVPVGTEFAVNNWIGNDQSIPSVATLSGGGFVVTWASAGQDGWAGGIYAQRFDASGAKVGSEFRVNASTDGEQSQPMAIGLAGGGFVIAFSDDRVDSSGTGVFGQRYDASGVALGANFQINTYVPSTQYSPALAALKDDPATAANETGFVAVWASHGQDGSVYGIYGQRFDGSGAKVGTEFAINTATSGNQTAPSVAALVGGDFVVVWNNDDNSVRGQRFKADGTAVGSEFAINNVTDYPSDYYEWPKVAALANGGFVVSWDSYAYSAAAGNNYYNVWAQQFDAAGNKVDGAVLLSETGERTEAQPVVAGLGGSNFVAIWTANYQDVANSSDYGVYQRLFGAPGSIVREANPQLIDLETSVSFDEGVVNAAPQIIDAGVRVVDADAVNFNGGKLTVSVLQGYGSGNAYDVQAAAQDNFSIRHEGNAAGQVGVSGTAVGSTISYGGVVVGTVESSGQGGQNLVIGFNANATAAIVEHVVEQLAYANTSSAPVTSRQVAVVISDGQGGQSAVQTIDIQVTPQTDGAVALTGDVLVNTYTTDYQAWPTTIHLQGANAGLYLTTWHSTGQDSDGNGVFGQIYSLDGQRVGPEFQINTTTPGDQWGQWAMKAGALSDGGFVVAWESPDGWSRGIYAQRYDASLNPVGSEWRVNPATNYDQIQPEVIGLANGRFVIAYVDDNNADGSSFGIQLQLYAADGTAEGAPLLANQNPSGVGTAFTDGNQGWSKMSALANGGFVVTWDSQYQDGAAWGVYARVYGATGTPLTDAFKVNTWTLGSEERPDVATLSNGDFVIVWTTDNAPGTGTEAVRMQRYTAAGVPIGAEMLVNDTATVPHYDAYPRVAALDNGGYVVAWDGYDNSGRGFYVQQYDAAGNKVDGPLLVNTTTSSDQGWGDVTGLANGRFVVSWSAYNQVAASPSTYDVFQKLFGTAGSLVVSAQPVLSDVDAAVTFAENDVNAAPQIIDGAIGLFDSDSANFDGGRLTVSVISGYSSLNQDIGDYRPDQDQFSILSEGTGAGQVNVLGSSVRVGTTVIGSIVADGQGRDLVIQFNASATQPLVEHVIERLAYANPSTDPVTSRLVSITVSDGDGATSDPRLVTINLTQQADGAEPLFEPSAVNTYQTSTQDTPAIGKLADGGYVIAWQSYGQDGWYDGIFAQRYAANGTPVGNEFKVSGATPGQQLDASVAGLADGGWVVVYTSDSTDGSGYGVLAQQFNAAGQKVGDEHLVNTTTLGSQYQPAVSALGSGYVVAWYSDYLRDGYYYDVFFQRYDASGNRVGSETRANTPVVGELYTAQYEPAIVAIANGNFVVTWRSDGQDGNASGVYAQLFNGSTGAAIGSEFQLNQYTTDYQFQPKLAAFGGGFVAVWNSRGQDGSGDGIYARVFDASGNPVGNEFRVNEDAYSTQDNPDVAATGDGGFVVTWHNGSPNEIYAQKFSATGARVDGALVISSDNTTSENLPVVVGLNGNAFAVAWQGWSDGDGYGVFQRIVGDPAQFTVNQAPQIVDMATSVTFQENALNSAPQVIDPGIGLLDVDSANFDGGRLDVSFITAYGDINQYGIPGIQTQDQLGIRNEGTAAGNIGVNGTTITYGGTAIGTVIGNGVNGAPLTVLFNANATSEAVENLIENLTYQNYLSNPEPTRTVSLRLSDGDGGVTAPLAITLNIVQNPDGAVLFGPERVVSRTAASGNQPSTQSDAAIAHLAGGGYVVSYVDSSGLDGSASAVYARVYDANDNALGDPFRVNVVTANTQDEPDVVGLSGGGFAVVWRSNGNTAADANQDNSGYGVYMRRFDASGTALDAADLRVNTSTPGSQYQPAVAQSSDGGYIVAWYNDNVRDGQYYDIYFQRFDASGAAVGGETRANTSVPTNNFIAQHEPAIALLSGASGDFVITWRDDQQDGDGSGIFAQRFNADGSKDGTEFQVNTYITSSQYDPSIAALKDGGFVISWTSSGQDGSGEGVYAQRYGSDGQPVGAEFRVNYLVSGTQYHSSVTGLVNGGFVVTWDDGSNVWLQQYDAGGRAIDSQLTVNDISTENAPDIVATADGGFLVAYTGYRDTGHGGNNSYEVLVQRYSNTAPNVSDVNVAGNEDADIPLLDTLFAAGFNDAEGQTLAAVRIVTLPGLGTLYFNGVAVTPGLEVDVASLAAGKLVYRGNPDYVGADQFRWTGSDGNVFASTTVFTNITVNNVNDGPRLVATPDRVANEGFWMNQSITLGDPDVGNIYRVTVDWGYSDQNGPVIQTFTTTSKTPDISHIFPDNGNFTVTVTVDDQQGQPNSVETDSFVVNVSNVAPVLSLFGNNTVLQGDTYTLTLGGVNDPGADTVTQYAIDWGDGSAVEIVPAANLPANREITHTYSTANAYTIHTQLTDEDGSFPDAGTKTITVAPPAEVIAVAAGADAGIGEGQLFSRTVTFTDPADQDPAGRSATINWGDGTPVQTVTLAAGQFSFNISHVFADNRATPFTVDVSVTDNGAQTGVDSFDVAVSNVAPTIGLSGNGAVNEGSSYTLTLGAVNDVATDTVTEYRIDWGDGSAVQVVAAGAMPANRQLSHTYADGDIGGSARQIAVTLVDEDGVFANAGTHTVTVNNVAPTVNTAGNAAVAEGSAYTLTVGPRVDPGADTPTLYRIDWGDGSAQSQYTPAQYDALVAAGGQVTHVFADGGSNPTIIVRVFDEDGEHVAATRSVSVTDVAPTATLGGAASVPEGSAFALSIANLQDPGQDTVSEYRILWGDEAIGGAAQVVSAAALAAAGGIVA